MAEYDKMFDKTGAGSNGNGDNGEADRKRDLKELNNVFSKKNIFGGEKMAEEATQAAILEQNVKVNETIQSIPNQEVLLKSIADVFVKQGKEAAENAFEAQQDQIEQNKLLEDQKEVAEETAKQAEISATEDKNRGSMIGRLGGAMAGAGIAAAGLGVALFASAKAMKEFEGVEAVSKHFI